jgi:hypothetical protein
MTSIAKSGAHAAREFGGYRFGRSGRRFPDLRPAGERVGRPVDRAPADVVTPQQMAVSSDTGCSLADLQSATAGTCRLCMTLAQL